MHSRRNNSPKGFDVFEREYVAAMHSFLVSRFGERWHPRYRTITGSRAPCWLVASPSHRPRIDALASVEAHLIRMGFRATVERIRVARVCQNDISYRKSRPSQRPHSVSVSPTQDIGTDQQVAGPVCSPESAQLLATHNPLPLTINELPTTSTGILVPCDDQHTSSDCQPGPTPPPHPGLPLGGNPPGGCPLSGPAKF